MVYLHENIVGLDSAIFMRPEIWRASGHIDGFSDSMVDCKDCKSRFRADFVDLSKNCPNCKVGNNFTSPRSFNLMFKTHIGVVEDSSNEIYLRPETAQGIFVNFRNVLDSSRLKIPFGIAQVGKAFRNEIVTKILYLELVSLSKWKCSFLFIPSK